MVTAIVWIGLGTVATLDLVATVLVIRSSVLTSVQKTLQLMFTWVVPFIGSIIVIAVVKETLSNPRSCREFGPSSEVWLPGIGPESGGAGGHHDGHIGSGDVGHGGNAGFGGH
jgi:hypothetical protein